MEKPSNEIQTTLHGSVSNTESSCKFPYPPQCPRRQYQRAFRKRVEVISDDESEIIEASRRMVKNYDFIMTSGGIGPTHDGEPSIINFHL